MRYKMILTRLTRILPVLLVLALGCACQTNNQSQKAGLRIGVSYSKELDQGPLDGRMLLMISDDASREPRFQISSRNSDAQLIFGLDVDGLKPGDAAIFDAAVFGFPLKSMAEIPPGDYVVQALLHKYETFHRADGHTVKLPMDRGEGQRWNLAPGNLYSTPKKMRIDPRKDELIKCQLWIKLFLPFPKK